MRHARSNYISFFNRALRHRRDLGENVTEEVCLALNKQVAHDLYRLFVVDILERKPDGSIGVVEINADPVFASHPELTIDAPVAWNGITFRCTPFAFPESRLIAWGERWIHDEAPPLGPQDGLTGIIHSVTPPERVRGLIEFSVDFGSAPFEAFEELHHQLFGRIHSIGSAFTDEA
jgi:hypothetical protein